MLVLLVAAWCLMGLPAPQALAEPTNTGRTAPSMLVLDGSGSMRAEDVDGRSRMDVAKEAVSTLVPLLPDDASVGLMTYGNSAPEIAADRSRGCQDVKTLVPAKGLDRDRLLTETQKVQPAGFTPIGLALRTAEEELPDSELRSIVLVSDGIDECGDPPPCEVAADLAQAHLELAVHTIGFKADDAARNELSCIAETTGGTYADATDAVALRDELLVKMTRALQGYDAAGLPVHGGESVEDAVAIEPGSYLDMLETGSDAVGDGQGSSRYYSLQLAPGEVAHIAATMVLPPGAAATNRVAQLAVRTLAPDGSDCRVGDSTSRAEANLGDGPVTAAVATPRMAGTDNLACFGKNADGRVILQVERTGNPSKGMAVPVEVQVFIEQEVHLDRPPASEKQPRVLEALPQPGSGERIQPAFSFASAVDAGGEALQGTIIPGEVQFFRVPVQYGQQLRTAVQLGEFEPPPGVELTLEAKLISPLRESVYSVVPPNADASSGGSSAKATPGMQVQLNQATRVQFQNRATGGTAAKTSFLAGDYYLQLALVPSTYDATRLFEVPYTLDTDVVGEVTEGPEFSGQGALKDRTATDPGAAPASDGGGEPSDGGATAAPLETDGAGPRVPPIVWVVAGGLLAGAGIAGAAIGGMVLLRRLTAGR